MREYSFDRRAALDGARRIAPLAAPGVPFGLVLGVLIRDSGIDVLAGWSSGFIIFAGAAQLAALNLLADDASALVIILTVVFINARHAMYSAALRPRFATFPTWFRWIGPYFLLDQQFAVAESTPELRNAEPRYVIWHWLGAGTVLWSIWMLSMTAGVIVGDIVDEGWSLNFAVPLLFGGLLVLAVKDRPGALAATVAAVIAVVGQDLPQGSGLLLAIVVGVVVGGMAEQARSSGENT